MTGKPHRNAGLAAVDTWPGTQHAVVVAGPDGVLGEHGVVDERFPLASVTKPLVADATLVAIEEGSLALDAPIDVGTSLRHLLAHASGMAPNERTLISPPGMRRIYSNAGFEVVGELLATTGIDVAAYLDEAVLAPLGMQRTSLDGSPASGAVSTATDLARFATELLVSTLVAATTLDDATRVQFPGLDGVLPGFGRQSPNDWGLGFELRNGKHPHWTAPAGSPRTFGHFGRSGTFVWVDPDARAGLRLPRRRRLRPVGRRGRGRRSVRRFWKGRWADRLAVAHHEVLAVGIVLETFARRAGPPYRRAVRCELHDVGLPNGIARVGSGQVRGQGREHDDVTGSSGHRHRTDRIVQALPAVVGHPVLEGSEAMEARHHPRAPVRRRSRQ